MSQLFILSEVEIVNSNSAIASRILNYCNALSQKDIEVRIINLYKKYNITNLQSLNTNDQEEFTKKYIFRYITAMRNIIKLVKIFKEKSENITILRLPSSFLIDIFVLVVFKYQLKIPIIYEKNELKTAMILNYELSDAIWKKTIKLIILPFQLFKAFLHDLFAMSFTGLIVISTKLENLYSKICKNIQRVPILVDIQKFGKYSENENYFNNNFKNFFMIGFFGSIAPKKEGIFDLLDALKLLAIKNVNFRLNIYGYASRGMKKKLQEKLGKELIDDKIFFGEMLSHLEALKKMKEQNLLILTRPSNLQTNYGFATKLGEYLASSVPVLVTDVSDNALYIKDGVNGFIISSNTPNLIATKLEEIMERNDLDDIGIKGRETAKKNFDYRNYTKQLYSFLFENK